MPRTSAAMSWLSLPRSNSHNARRPSVVGSDCTLKQVSWNETQGVRNTRAGTGLKTGSPIFSSSRPSRPSVPSLIYRRTQRTRRLRRCLSSPELSTMGSARIFRASQMMPGPSRNRSSLSPHRTLMKRSTPRVKNSAVHPAIESKLPAGWGIPALHWEQTGTESPAACRSRTAIAGTGWRTDWESTRHPH